MQSFYWGHGPRNQEWGWASRVKQKEGKFINSSMCRWGFCYRSWGSIPGGLTEKHTEPLSVVHLFSRGWEAGASILQSPPHHQVALRNWPVSHHGSSMPRAKSTKTPSVWSRVACVNKVSFADLSTAAQLSSEVCWETVAQAQEAPPVTLLLGYQSGELDESSLGKLTHPRKRIHRYPTYRNLSGAKTY